jgi:Leucine-rich repeat (LRR) protein
MESLNNDVFIYMATRFLSFDEKIVLMQVCKQFYHLGPSLFINDTVEYTDENKDWLTKYKAHIEVTRLEHVHIPNIHTLRLLNRNLTNVPINTSLHNLDVLGNKIVHISRSINTMVNLHKLDLSYNCIKGIPDTIVDLKNLCYLNLSNNFLKELPDALCNLPNLELLDVDENLLKYMPNLPSNLIYFSAAGNGLFDVPQNFDELIHLEQVYLTNNKLVSLPSLHALKKLTVLNLCNNSLFELPVLAPALNELDVSNNQLKALPSCIGDLSDLEILTCSHNRLKCLPNTMYKLENLVQLDASFNKLKQLPRLPDNLEYFYISRNYISVISQHLLNLKVLSARENEIVNFPLFTTAIEIDLSFNELVMIPTNIYKLRVLQSLDLHSNHLTELPYEVGNLTNLTFLNLSHNELTCLQHKHVHKLRRLQELDLSWNPMTILPKCIKYMSKTVVNITGTFDRLLYI